MPTNNAGSGGSGGVGGQRWSNLVSETQFAVDLILTGLRRVSRLPMEGSIFGEISYDQTFPLHVGLHTYTSGLERLCKLALACEGFLETGSFPSVRKFSHKIGPLLDEIEKLGPFEEGKDYLIRPTDEYEADLVAWLEQYSSGSGRYELLDSLSSGATELPTWETWVAFCSRGSISESVQESILLLDASGEALREIAMEHDLESVASPMLENFENPISEKSAAVGLAMFRRARWVASILDKISYYTHEDLPILGEALFRLEQTSDDFFAFEVARLSDPDVVREELIEHRENFTSSAADDNDDSFDEDGEQDPISPSTIR